jgi:hypothetical protein
MTHPTMGAVIQLPNVPLAERQIDASHVFGHHLRPGHRGWLWPLDVDGTEYLTDRYVTIRADRVTGVDSDKFDVLPSPPAVNVARAVEALAAPLAGTPSVARFDVREIAGLYAAGCGVLPLAGERTPDVHAVMFCGQRIGLITPIPASQAAHWLGVIPGLPPSLADVEWLELTR